MYDKLPSKYRRCWTTFSRSLRRGEVIHSSTGEHPKLILACDVLDAKHVLHRGKLGRLNAGTFYLESGHDAMRERVVCV